ncbi:hypothetical protein [Roseovarius ramblicola]|uniref:DUF3035 domain-containing protein n=1 Tax=Roseovarius ramblicola TaxID=2022336 RepID=A0ABV5HYG1_9RHOB
MRPLPACLAAMIALAACTEPYPVAPDLVASGAAAPYPDLVPAERIAAQVPPDLPPGPSDTAAPSPAETIGSRAARLRARADRLSGPVIDPDTETRMRRGVAE